LTIAHLTLLDARRRKIVVVALLGALLYVAVYGTAMYFIEKKLPQLGPQRQGTLAFLTIAGLYVANFLTIAASVLLPIDTLSGEIASGVMQTLASKPVHRAEIVLGKWLAFAAMSAVYLALTAGGVVLMVDVFGGYVPPHLARSYALLVLGAVLMITISMAGGARLSTVTNGIVAFAFYGIAFIGGWIEQIGTMTGVTAARYIGTAISLVSPIDSLWRRAAYELQPPLLRALPTTPFNAGGVPTAAMIAWSAAFCVVLFAAAIRFFQKRPL
jgi:ABC-type transport system involved in multi-copper enzyme maturation permease subunit